MRQDLNSYWRLQGNVVIVGLSGVGKTTVGKELATRLGVGFLDLDQWIETQEKSTVANIISKKGEVYFRTKESEALNKLNGLSQHIIAVGSGAVEAEGNWELLNQLGTVVWLHCAVDVLAKRLLKVEKELVKRPLLATVLNEPDMEIRQTQLEELLQGLLTRREPFYKEARFTLVDSASTPKDCSAHLHTILERISFKKSRHQNKPHHHHSH